MNEVRHGALLTALEQARGGATAVVVMAAPRGAGLSSAMRAFADDVRGRGVPVDVIDCERVGVQPGGGLDHLLRARFSLPLDASDEAVWAALEQPALGRVTRELFAWALGVTRGDFETRGLDPLSRWEGVQEELARLVPRPGGWALVLDDALKAAPETLRFLAQLGEASREGLVVLAIHEEERAALRERFPRLSGSAAWSEVTLPPLSAEALSRAFPHTAARARGMALTARLLEVAAVEGPAPGPELLVGRLVAELPPEVRRALDALIAVGGRLPLSAAGVLPASSLEALQRRLLLQRGPTARARGGDEVWLAFPGWMPAVPDAQASTLRALFLPWAERTLAGGLRSLHPLALQLLSTGAARPVASLAAELRWRLTGEEGDLRLAARDAAGVRRLVLARLLAEAELFRGDVQRALNTATSAARQSSFGSTKLPQEWVERLHHETGDELERWVSLSHDEAQVALELVRAEALSHLGVAHDTRRAFEQLESRLRRLTPGPAVTAAWLRLARTWVWFAAEVLADGGLARRICDTVRGSLSPDAIHRSTQAMGFLRAEQVAHSRGGDPLRARELADELISLSEERGDLKEECVAWNSRGLLHLRDGELERGKAAFTRSLELAQLLGFKRREAVALHNRGLMLAFMGDAQASLDSQQTYLALSERIGNTLARAYGPAAMAMVHVMGPDLARAEAELETARRAAEENGWPGLLAWTRHLAGTGKLLQARRRKDTLLLSRARLDFLACLDVLEDRQTGWSEELDPAETGALLAMTHHFSQQTGPALQAMERAKKYAHGSAASPWVLAAAKDVLEGRVPEASLAWFRAHSHHRAAELWQRLAG